MLKGEPKKRAQRLKKSWNSLAEAVRKAASGLGRQARLLLAQEFKKACGGSAQRAVAVPGKRHLALEPGL